MTTSENITLESIYKEIVSLKRDVAQIKKSLTEEPGLRDSFIARMKDIDREGSVRVEDFGRRYGIE